MLLWRVIVSLVICVHVHLMFVCWNPDNIAGISYWQVKLRHYGSTYGSWVL